MTTEITNTNGNGSTKLAEQGKEDKPRMVKKFLDHTSTRNEGSQQQTERRTRNQSSSDKARKKVILYRFNKSWSHKSKFAKS